jgi:hypothetical protein
MFPILAGSNPSGYNITRSLRLRASASAYLSRTPATSGSLTTWTWGGWVKRGALGTIQPLFGYIGATQHYIRFLADNTLDIALYDGASYLARLVTTQVFRDPSAYYHIVVIWNTTNATASNRVQLYINGVQVTAFSTATYPAQNTTGNINSNAYSHGIGSYPTLLTNYFDGYLTEVNFIDGQALTPSSFGETDTITGVWKPKAYSGTYGTNGFELQFTDNSALTTSSNVGLGKDFSGNGNYWITNNISITAGVTYDSMTDVPTLTSATASNFCVINPLRNSNTTITAANLNVASPSNTCGATGTFAVNTGKWYWEVNCISNGTNTANGVPHIGIIASDESSLVGSATNMYLYRANGDLYTGAGYGQTGLATYTNNDVIGVAYDAGANSLQFYKNNTAVGTPISTTTNKLYQPYWLVSYVSVNSSAAYNFGQRPFTYTPPTGFVALNTFNLPTSTIVKGNTVMDATLYTGTLLSNSITNAASFKPDLVWIKSRSAATDNKLTDSVRGVTKGLISNTTGAETTDTQGLTAFNTNGFTVGTDTNYNNLAATYVGWQWQAGQGTNTTNTNGTITSTVSVNASAGFSVVTYTGNGTNGATAGHGLGVTPGMVLIKQRNSTGSWIGWHQSISQAIQTSSTIGLTGYTGAIYLNLTNASSTYGFDSQVNGSGSTYVAYCWSQISGFSSFGSYVGNGSATGPFVYLGFRPAFVMVKASSTTSNWSIMDNKRTASYNSISAAGLLYPNLSNAEAGSGEWIDFLSNGFKIVNAFGDSNSSGVTYIYAAYAENPFKNSLAR